MLRGWLARKDVLGFALFAISFAVLWWLAGDVWRFSRDEGILLEGGGRIAEGQQPYRDFFELTGPFSFWIAAILFKLDGGQLPLQRLPMILDVSFLVWAVFWMVSRFASRYFSASFAIAFLAFQAVPRKLWVNHRWHSAALATGAIVVAMQAHRKNSGALWALSGFLVAAAAWATPSLLLVGPALLFWVWRSNRRHILPFLGGGALITSIAALYLQASGALAPMIQSMLWTGANYTGANRVPYGAIISLAGTAGNFYNRALWENPLGSLLALFPAIAPVLALAGWSIYQWQAKERGNPVEISALLTATAALAFSAWPRWTADELSYTAALSSALCAVLLYRLLPTRALPGLCAFFLLTGGVSLGEKAYAASEDYDFPSRVGTVRASGADREFLESLERRIQPGESLFAFPYLPQMYYLLRAHNPTRYSFLQPGMMTKQDEATALAELAAARPRWVIFEDVPEGAILVIWPGSNRSTIPMTAINTYLRDNYHDVDVLENRWGRFVIKERTGQAR